MWVQPRDLVNGPCHGDRLFVVVFGGEGMVGQSRCDQRKRAQDKHDQLFHRRDLLVISSEVFAAKSIVHRKPCQITRRKRFGVDHSTREYHLNWSSLLISPVGMGNSLNAW